MVRATPLPGDPGLAVLRVSPRDQGGGVMEWTGWLLILLAWILASVLIALGLARWFRWIRCEA